MELYPENLESLKSLLDFVEGIGAIDGVFEVEIKVRLDDADEWAVIGYGESGDPCVLRFEKKTQPVTAFPFPHPTGPGIRSPGVGITTINKMADSPTCSCGDFSYSSKGGACGPNGCYNRPA